MLAAFFDQFNVVRLITIQAFPGDVTFTNSSMMMGLVITII